MTEAAVRGHDYVHLFTAGQDAYYLARGWRAIAEVDHRGERAGRDGQGDQCPRGAPGGELALVLRPGFARCRTPISASAPRRNTGRG